jgi:myosin-5
MFHYICRSCSFTTGESLKAGLSKVEFWIMQQDTNCVGVYWEELRHIRQAVTFLVADNKWKMTLEDITRDLCPDLTITQLYRISSIYRDDTFRTDEISREVRSMCRQGIPYVVLGLPGCCCWRLC